MDGDPAHFEAIGSRLGFRVIEDGAQRTVLEWQGARFPAFLCLGIALGLLFVSVPIVEALRIRGFEGPAASLWYFPLMNLILLGISTFLLSLKRTLVFNHRSRTLVIEKRSVWRTVRLVAHYQEVAALALGIDQVYSGFAVAGSSSAEKFPVPSLRLKLDNGHAVLLDRGSVRRLEPIGKRLSEALEKPLELDPALRR